MLHSSYGLDRCRPNKSSQTCSTAKKGLDLVEQEWPNFVIVHPDFEDSTLSELIQELRGFSNVPLLVLGNEGDEMEAVTSLELGADDYVRLPCDLTELTTRMWALMRRAGTTATYETENPLTSGQLMVNPATYEAFLSGRRLTLTTTEFRMLFLLIKNWGIVVSRQTLERTLWGERVDSYGLVKKYVQRLRQKLGDDAREPFWIANVHGVGYRFIGPTPKAQENGAYNQRLESAAPAIL